MSALTSKIKALQKKAKEKDQWAVVSTAAALLADEDNLDARINFIGSMQEVGLLSNSLAPYWTVWRSGEDEQPWVERCLARLRADGHDHDYWAAAALLGVSMDTAKRAMAALPFKLVCIRHASTYVQGGWQIATFCKPKPDGDRVLAPVIELGWADHDQLVNEVSRWRAVLMNEKNTQVVNGSLTGTGSGSYYLRAKLPYGCWRIHEDNFEIKPEWVVAKEDTILKDYP